MAGSTGTAVFTVNRDQLISNALRKLRILQDGATASANQITNASESLNIMIKNAQSAGMQLWTYMLLPIPLVANQFTYTIGPSGANVTSVRPLRLMDNGSFLRNTSVNPPLDTPLVVLSRTDYMNFGSKQSQGTVNSIYYDAQINSGAVTSPSVGFGTLYAYVNPLAAGFSIYGNFQRPLYDMTSATDEFDFPSEWFMYLTWGLAAELADEYEVPEDRITRITNKAEYFHRQLQDWSVEQAPMRLQPDMRMGSRWG